MKKFLLAAVLLAPLTISPSFAQGAGDAAGFVDTARIQTRMARGDDMLHTGSVLRTRRNEAASPRVMSPDVFGGGSWSNRGHERSRPQLWR
ncbi:MAG: hypothetical protein J0H01_36620 [Rhizobiales bacterium]|nr:hypothetical protein [Hyphomicrobiales bacterium]